MTQNTSHPTSAGLFLRERRETPFAARLLGNLLLHPPELPRESGLHDPELEFLLGCSGFGLVICSVAFQSDSPRTMQQLVQQQCSAYEAVTEALLKGTGAQYFCITTELDNQLAALLIPRVHTELDTDAFCEDLSEALAETLQDLTENMGIPVYTVYCTQKELMRLSHNYNLMKNALVYLDYIHSGNGTMIHISEPVPRAHIGLWNQMETSSGAFIDAFLQGDAEAAVAEVDAMIAAITDWISPSKDNLLADIQYYFDLIFNRLSAQFGDEVTQGVLVTEAIFETTSLRQLRENLQNVVHELFRNMRRNTSGSTFRFFQEIRSYMDENIRDYNLSAADIAARFSISPQLLSIQFKKCFGVTPIRYIEGKRVELIQEELLHTDLPIEQICARVGMGSVSTLHRVFQKHCGQSPGVFRRTARAR